jgi:hypothetical protein
MLVLPLVCSFGRPRALPGNKKTAQRAAYKPIYDRRNAMNFDFFLCLVFAAAVTLIGIVAAWSAF